MKYIKGHIHKLGNMRERQIYEKLKGYYMLTYPYTYIIVISFLLSASWIGYDRIFINLKIVISLVLGVFWASQINILNNIHDIKSDSVQDFEKPLVKGTLSISQAYTFWVLLYILSLVVSIFINRVAFIISIFVPLLAVAYSGKLKLKRWTPLAHIIMATGYGLILFTLGWTLDNSIQALPIPIILTFFLISTLITLSKDYKDIKEDLSVGIKTLPAYSLKGSYYFQFFYDIGVYSLVFTLAYLGYLSNHILFFLPTILLFLLTLCYIIKQRTPEGYAKGYLLSIISGAVAILIFGVSYVI